MHFAEAGRLAEKRHHFPSSRNLSKWTAQAEFLITLLLPVPEERATFALLEKQLLHVVSKRFPEEVKRLDLKSTGEDAGCITKCVGCPVACDASWREGPCAEVTNSTRWQKVIRQVMLMQSTIGKWQSAVVPQSDGEAVDAEAVIDTKGRISVGSDGQVLIPPVQGRISVRRLVESFDTAPYSDFSAK